MEIFVEREFLVYGREVAAVDYFEPVFTFFDVFGARLPVLPVSIFWSVI